MIKNFVLIVYLSTFTFFFKNCFHVLTIKIYFYTVCVIKGFIQTEPANSTLDIHCNMLFWLFSKLHAHVHFS